MEEIKSGIDGEDKVGIRAGAQRAGPVSQKHGNTQTGQIR